MTRGVFLRGATPEERWWSYVGKADPVTGCREWTGGRLGLYGAFHYQGRVMNAHRAGWILLRGPITDRKHVLHLCDNPPCVLLDHLYLGTPQDNARDVVAHGYYRSWNGEKTHCKRGHEFTPENTYITKRGHRECHECRKMRVLGRISQ